MGEWETVRKGEGEKWRMVDNQENSPFEEPVPLKREGKGDVKMIKLGH
jgi:hypothetical protein